MGYMRHHAIIVTSWDTARLQEAHEAARERLGEEVSEIVPSRMNGYGSFLVAPDGSKEGWADSDDGEAQRDAFVAWLNDESWEDGSSPFDWVLVQFGDEDEDQRVVAASNLRASII